MTRKEKAAFVSETLGKLYPHPAIPLDHADAFTLLVAVWLTSAVWFFSTFGLKR